MRNALEHLRIWERRIGRHRRLCSAVAWITCALGWSGLALVPGTYRAVAAVDLAGAATAPRYEPAFGDPGDLLRIPGTAGTDSAPTDGEPFDPATLCWNLEVRALGAGRLSIQCAAADPASAERAMVAALTALVSAWAADGRVARRELAPSDEPREASGARTWRSSVARSAPTAARTVGPARDSTAATRVMPVVDGLAVVRADRGARIMTSAIILLVGLASGAVVAAWAARSDQCFDRAADLQAAFAVPVLGSLTTIAARRPLAWAVDARLAALLVAFGSVAGLEACDLLKLPVVPLA